MFVTNGYQALIDYRPQHPTLFASTLRDKKSKPSFEPTGRVAISLLKDIWVIDICSTHENRLLAIALIKHFICKNGDSLTFPSSVERALSQLAYYGLLSRKLSPIIEAEDSFIHDFCFDYTLKKTLVKRDEVIQTIVHSLKVMDRRFNDIKNLDQYGFRGPGLEHLEDDLYLYKRLDGKVPTLLISIEDHMYLTNLVDTEANRFRLKSLHDMIASLKRGFQSCSKSFIHVTIHTLSMLVNSRIRIRPAAIIKRDDETLSVIHRPFLSTEKSFEEIRPVLRNYASKLLEAR